MLLSDLIEYPAKEGESLEHVRLVDAGERTGPATRLAAFGELEGKREQPLRGPARDQHGLARLLMGDGALPHRGEQAFGRFADHDEIDTALLGAHDRARHARDQPRRAYPGIEIEQHAQLDLRRD